MGCFSAILCEDSPDVRESKTVLDSGFHDMDRFRIPTTVFEIVFSGTWIRDSNRQWDSRTPTALYSGFQGLGFRIPQVKISKILVSGFPNMGREDDVYCASVV